MNKKILFAGIIALVAVSIGWRVAHNNVPASPAAILTTGEAKSFVVTGNNFSFIPPAITLKKGDRVRITFKDDDGYHDLKIDGYDVATQRVNTGGEGVVEFTADKVGSFAYYCSVGSHRDLGMQGMLTVTE